MRFERLEGRTTMSGADLGDLHLWAALPIHADDTPVALSLDPSSVASANVREAAVPGPHVTPTSEMSIEPGNFGQNGAHSHGGAPAESINRAPEWMFQLLPYIEQETFYRQVPAGVPTFRYRGDPKFTGGVFVAAGDLNSDGNADVIVSGDGYSFKPLFAFYTADLDHRLKVNIGPSAPVAPPTTETETVTITVNSIIWFVNHSARAGNWRFDPQPSSNGFIVATGPDVDGGQTFTGSVLVAAGDLNADGFADIIVTPQGGGAGELQFRTDGPIIAQALFQRLAPRAPQYGAQINYAGDSLEIYFDPAYSVTQGGVQHVPVSPLPMLVLAGPSNADLVAMHRALNQLGAQLVHLRDQYAYDPNVAPALQSLVTSFDAAIAGFQAELTTRGFKIFSNGPGSYSGTIHVPRPMWSPSYWLDGTHQVLAY
ncbi:MAG: hypothetical protein L0211_14895 [Planctomycetaceae bacterium]|nr:hypothetical protein [Planctomycetaceae bacterium]